MRSKAIILMLALGIAAPAMAAKPRTEVGRAAVLDALSACRKVTDGPARLICYDRAAGALDEAEAKGQVVVLDREQVRSVRRQAFGLELPAFSLFGGRGGAAAEDRVDRETYTLRGGGRTPDGKWVFYGDDGTNWIQTDDDLETGPRKGSTMAVRRAAMGSYFCNIDGQRGVRCKRQR